MTAYGKVYIICGVFDMSHQATVYKVFLSKEKAEKCLELNTISLAGYHIVEADLE